MRNNVGKKEDIRVIPDGIWESSIPQKTDADQSKQKHQEEIQMDEQKNGYPLNP